MELKNCPFCGNNPAMTYESKPGYGYAVVCDCRIKQDPRVDKKQAIKDWNTRASSGQLVELDEEELHHTIQNWLIFDMKLKEYNVEMTEKLKKAILACFGGQPAQAKEQEYIKENCKCYSDGTGAHYISKGCLKHDKSSQHFTAPEVDKNKIFGDNE